MIFWKFDLYIWPRDPIWPRNFFSSSNFCRDCQDVSCHQISWQYLVTLMSWNFFCEKRFLTLIDLRWPLTPCWSRDIIGLAHCYFGPSLMKIGHKTWEIWTIKVLKERKKKEERRKKERKKRCKTNHLRLHRKWKRLNVQIKLFYDFWIFANLDRKLPLKFDLFWPLR